MIVTDSLGAPRKHSKVVEYKDTWPGLLYDLMLKQFDYSNFVFTKQGLDANQLKEYHRMKLDLYDKKFVFIHIGIVDCARRVLSEKMYRIVSMTPIVRSIVKYFASKYHYSLTKLYKVVFTNEKIFKHNVTEFLNSFKEAKIYIIPILPVGDVFRTKSFDIDNQIKKYNLILREISESNINIYYLDEIFSDFYPINNEVYMTDGYHINEKAHEKIFKILSRTINEVPSK